MPDKEILTMEQGTPEWLALRKSKITATDISAIMGVNPWKTIHQLYDEKLSDGPMNSYMSPAMQRGVELEPIARDLYWLKTGIAVEPRVVVKGWAMASLDGLSACGKHVLEIKCPGEVTHAIAVDGKVPDYYMPQLQWQMHVCDADSVDYFSFDGYDGVIVKVARDQQYIANLVMEATKFYQCLRLKTPPTPIEKFIERDDTKWRLLALDYRDTLEQIKELEASAERLKKRLIDLSGGSNSRGSGITVTQVARAGNIDYSSIPELKNINLEQYRKPTTVNWRISC